MIYMNDPETKEPNYITPEKIEKEQPSVETALKIIEDTEKIVSEETKTSGTELIKLTDNALVYVAEKTVEAADEDGVRSETELSNIEKSFETAVVEGALEEAGVRASSGKNPIIDLDKSGLSQDLTTAISELHSEDAKLPTGENVAELAVVVIDQEQKEPVPETLYRGERVYLNNIDQIGQRDLSTTGREQTHNKHGKIFLSRDIDYAINYSIGKDGVTWYDRPLTKEEIPIGVVYKIDNSNNIIGATPEGNPHPELFGGELAGKHREFTADSVPTNQYKVAELQILDDYIQPNGHSRSDMRDILERFTIDDPAKLPEVIEAVKKRIDELDAKRNNTTT